MPTYAEPKPEEKSAADMQAAHLAWSLSQPASGGCLFCPDFRPVGTCAEVQEACAEHRRSVHPEIKHVTRRRRGTRGGVMSYQMALSDEEADEIARQRERRLRLLGIVPEE